MKIKKIQIRIVHTILLLVSFFSYTQAQELDPYKFFPANIGDRWEYTRAGGVDIFEIVKDSIDIQDASRFIYYEWPPSFFGANYRITKHYDVFYVPQFDNWYIYKLNAKVDESWIVRAEEYKAAKVLDISQSYVFGKLTTVKTIGFYLLTRGDTVITQNSILQYWQKLAYGFGLISQEDGATQPFLLRGCRINGVTYGTVDVEEESKMVPSEFVLYQNYPNPFNPSTVIGYQLPVIGRVTLRVFDILGREIVTLVNEEKQAGKF
ncbi:MAG: hypothetical protein FD178_1106 [Ignavibacteria bacterium]|nr:MAG: hypothetical protein FD178_1106 [Ignavibacteria bacterium]